MKQKYLLLPLLALAACSSEEAGPSASKSPGASGTLEVCVSNYPLQYFAERIGGDAVDVSFLAPVDGDPAFWKPGDDEISVMQDAELLLLNGAAYEKWLNTVSLPESHRVDTSKGFADQFIKIKEAATHSHGKEGDHSHAGTAFTTWIDFDQALRQARTVKDAFARARPDRAATFDENFAALEEDLNALDAEMKAAAEIGGQPLFASHPVYQYWARRYGLEVHPFLWEPETVPDNFALEEMKSLREMHPASWMIWEGTPAPASVELLEAEGVKSVVFDPCGNVPEEGDWLAVMQQNIRNLEAVR